MSFTMILMMICLVLIITSVGLIIKGIKSKSMKYIGIAIVLLLIPVGMYYALLYFIGCM